MKQREQHGPQVKCSAASMPKPELRVQWRRPIVTRIDVNRTMTCCGSCT